MRKKLVKLFAEFWGIKPGQVKDSLEISDKALGDFSSIRFFQFMAAVESNLGVEVKDLAEIKTFADLAKNVGCP
jgi:acyl carrier protein